MPPCWAGVLKRERRWPSSSSRRRMGRARPSKTAAPGPQGTSMIGLFFEVQTRPGYRDQYLDLAASLKPELEAMGGCLFIDRFRSLTRENLLLSYQIWQDEGALTAWRAHAPPHQGQTIGRGEGFLGYPVRAAPGIPEDKPGQPGRQPQR